MSRIHCPRCQAELDAEVLAQGGRSECPLCGAPFEERHQTVPAADEQSAGDASPHAASLPELPAKSRILIVELSDDRVVLLIPGGGLNSKGLGWFALFWNLFMCCFTPPWFIGAFRGEDNQPPPMLVIVAFLGLFWAVGLGLAYFWLRLRYERTFVFLDRERIALQKTLLGRRRLNETLLTGDSRAELVEAYSQNDTPVYRIEVGGIGTPAKFGTALSDEEKNWLVDRINAFLGVETTGSAPVEMVEASSRGDPDRCEKCAAPLAGPPVDGILTCEQCGTVCRGRARESVFFASSGDRPSRERLTPDMLPQDSSLSLEENSRECLRFSLSMNASSPLWWVIPLLTMPFAMVWYGFLFAAARQILQMNLGGVAVVPLLFLIPFAAAGVMPLAMGLYAVCGKTTVELTHDRLSCRWSAGPLRFTKCLPVAAITSVRVEFTESRDRNPRLRAAKQRQRLEETAGPMTSACIARAGRKALWLAFFQERAVLHQVAALIRRRIEELGHSLDDDSNGIERRDGD
ncbi:MAG: hypothetical protein ACKV0T_12390 [Planctomycetales bacterium]